MLTDCRYEGKMKRDKKRRKSIVTLLRDAEPSFVSLVGRGANQRPFHALKSQGGQSNTKESADMAKQRKIKTAAEVAVQRITFLKEHFPDAESVASFLTEKGYSEFEIVEDGDIFHVEDTPADQIEGDTREVESTSAKGVTYLVGDVKKSEAAEEDAGAGTETKGTETKGDGGDKADGGQDGGEVSGDADGEGQADAGDTGRDAPAETETAQGDQKGGEEASQTAKAAGETKVGKSKPRLRARKGMITVAGMSPAALAARYEDLADFFEEHGVSAKAFSDSVAEYTNGVTPGIYALSDAFMVELRKALKAGKADEGFITSLSGEFAASVLKMTAAYQSIIEGGASTTKSEEAGPDLDPVLDHLFGTPDGADAEQSVKAEDVNALKGDIAALSDGQGAIMAILQAALDRAAVEGHEEAMKAEDRGSTRVLSSRKSQDAEETTVEVEDPEAEAEEEQEYRRAAKRLGYIA